MEHFFEQEGHTVLKRYPVVCRWYPLDFVIAGIVNFYRLENEQISFDFPANPVFVNQPCLRFTDLPLVGRSGRHYSCFVMVQQSSLCDGHGYWKEKCIELDFELLTRVFKIEPAGIVWVEDLWMGPGALGPSLEYFVHGLEVGNAVFTEFLATNSELKSLQPRVVDMGAGLERFCWISQGTPNSYEAVFQPVLRQLKHKLGIECDAGLLASYGKYAGMLESLGIEGVAELMGASPQLLAQLEPVQALYAVCDFSRALLFALCDGGMPSNVGGGYNLRVILRQCLSLCDRYDWQLDLLELFELHARQLKLVCPELLERLHAVAPILDAEKKRYEEAKKRVHDTVQHILAQSRELSEQELIELYQSHGVLPEMLSKAGIKVKLSPDFYAKLIKPSKVEEKHARKFELKNLPTTRLLFYEEPNLLEFKAKVLGIFERRYVVLDATAFYPRGGGQEPDHGFIGSCKVVDVEKCGDVVVHEVEDCNLEVGQEVNCRINAERRQALSMHHTATHILNAAARKVLGEWVWQHSAFKEAEKARLDFTHFRSLSKEEVERIEELANEVVRQALPVRVEWLERSRAEQLYGFKIYQGGAVPSKLLRIVKVGEFDVEACAGTHCSSTAEVGCVLILSNRRISDGVCRLEFCCGPLAVEKLREQAAELKRVAEFLGVKEEEVPQAVERLFKEWKVLRKRLRKHDRLGGVGRA